MRSILNFFKLYEAAIYFLLGITGIYYAWKFWEAWQELRFAIYGLIKETAQRRLNSAAIKLFILFMMGVSVFVSVTFIRPLVPVTVSVSTQMSDQGLVGPTSEPELADDVAVAGNPTATPLPTVEVNADGCVEDSIGITSPESGEAVRGEIEVLGVVNVENVGFFKVEVAAANEGIWRPIFVGQNTIIDEPLVENWDTSRFDPGQYILQLIVTDNDGNEFLPCRIPITIGTSP